MIRALLVRTGIVFALAYAAIACGLVAQSIEATKPYTHLIAVWPAFVLAVGQGVFIALKKKDDPQLVPALGAFFPLAFYACCSDHTLRETRADYVPIVLLFAPILSACGALCGLLFERFPRLTVFVAILATTFTSIAVLYPSLPPIARGKGPVPSIEEIPSLPLAGVLVVDGAPILAHGVTYRNQHSAWDPAWCEVVAESNAPQFPTWRASVIYSCRARPVRCDDHRGLCLVEDADYATGYTYDYAPVGIRAWHKPDGRNALRFEAELLALGAMFLLYRARTAATRHLLVMSALAASATGFGMLLPLLFF